MLIFLAGSGAKSSRKDDNIKRKMIHLAAHTFALNLGRFKEIRHSWCECPRPTANAATSLKTWIYEMEYELIGTSFQMMDDLMNGFLLPESGFLSFFQLSNFVISTTVRTVSLCLDHSNNTFLFLLVSVRRSISG